MQLVTDLDDDMIEAARHKHPSGDTETAVRDAVRLYVELKNADELVPSE